MRGIVCLAPLMLLLVLGTPALGSNLLVNGDAESGSTSGWSTSSSAVVEALQSASQSTGTVEEFEGDWFFSLESYPASFAYLTQAGTSGLESWGLTLAGMVQTEDLAGDDYGTATLRIYGDAGVVLTEVSTPHLVTPNFTWLPFEVSVHVPAAAQSWEVTLSGTLVFGDHVNVFYDWVSLREICSPFDDVVCGHWACAEISACSEASIVGGYPDGLYHPEYAVTRDQMAVFVSRALAGGDENVPEAPTGPSFVDVPPDHWAYDYIEYAVAENVVQGYPEGDYRPLFEVTRGQMAVYVARAMAAPYGEEGLADYVPADPRNFPDVPDTFWAYTHVEYCVEYGVVSGYGDGLYHPERVVTRDQMAVYIARAFDLPT